MTLPIITQLPAVAVSADSVSEQGAILHSPLFRSETAIKQALLGDISNQSFRGDSCQLSG